MSTLISVGGTGQHVALAALRLKTLGALPEDLMLVAIDASDESEISKRLRRPWSGADVGDAHPLGLKRISPPFAMSGIQSQTFSQMYPQTLLEGFYSPAEAGLPVSDGMFGTPSVGASVVAGAFDSEIGKQLASLPAQPFFVAGSVIGGTGAGVMHKILHLLHQSHGVADVFGVFLLRWFDVSEGGQITAALMHRNEHLGLRYILDETVDHMKAGVLIGPPQEPLGPALPTVARGAGEHVSIYPLMACLGILDVQDVVVTNPDVRVWTISHDEAKSSWVLDHRWHGGVTLRKRYYRAIHVKLMLEYLIANHESKSLDANIFGGLLGGSNASAVTESLYHSVRDHLGSNRRDGSPGLAAMSETWKENVERLEFCCGWLKELFPELSQNEGCPPVLARRLSAPAELHKADFFRSVLPAYFGQPVPKADRVLTPPELATEFVARIVRGTEGDLP